jgi:uncharacterized membrane protein YhaH (DUF805 family)
MASGKIRRLEMDFPSAIRTVLLKKYLCFTGRASRSEYWFFTLFEILVALVIISTSSPMPEVGVVIQILLGLGLFLPSLGVSIRRLHDTNRSGWLYLLGLIPLVGFIILIIFFVQKGTDGPNRFGDAPLNH